MSIILVRKNYSVFSEAFIYNTFDESFVYAIFAVLVIWIKLYLLNVVKIRMCNSILMQCSIALLF